VSLPQRLKPDHFKPKLRLKSTAHRDWVRDHFCSVPGCQLMPIETHHIRTAANSGVGKKCSDAFIISLCRDHHKQYHNIGRDTFESRHGFDCMDKAREFYSKSPHRRKLDEPHVW
jgi:PIN domain nuclease of toxin-antitoxin system